MSNPSAKPATSCPACGHELSRAEQRAMNTLLGAARAVPCPNCGQRIQWLRTLHTRILADGLTFRIGVVALLAMGFATVAWPGSPLPHGLIALVGAALAVAGVLVTYTPAAQPLVELAGDDA